MATLKHGKVIFSDGLQFKFVRDPGESGRVLVFNAEGTHNKIDSYPIDTLDTQQDFEMEVSFWLYNNGAI